MSIDKAVSVLIHVEGSGVESDISYMKIDLGIPTLQRLQEHYGTFRRLERDHRLLDQVVYLMPEAVLLADLDTERLDEAEVLESGDFALVYPALNAPTQHIPLDEASTADRPICIAARTEGARVHLSNAGLSWSAYEKYSSVCLQSRLVSWALLDELYEFLEKEG